MELSATLIIIGVIVLLIVGIILFVVYSPSEETPVPPPVPPFVSRGVAEWATRIGSSGTTPEYTPQVTTDIYGNVYVSGSYLGANLEINNYESAPINQGEVTVTPYGILPGTSTPDFFLIKYNSSGKVQWATSINGFGSEYTSSITTDIFGNIYIAGQYDSPTLTIKNYNSAPIAAGNIGLTTYGTLSNSDAPDIFLVKYDTNGKVRWATKLNGADPPLFDPSIKTDRSGNVYIAGWYDGPTLTINNYDSAPVSGGNVGLVTYGTLTNSDAPDTFLVKYSGSGKAQWATRISGGGPPAFKASIAVDSSDNVYISGIYIESSATISDYDSAPIGGGAVGLVTYGTLTNSGDPLDVYLVKYNSSGKAQWATSVGGLSGQYNPQVATDTTGNVYISGIYSSSTLTIKDYDSAPIGGGAVGIVTYGTLTNSGDRDIFLVKYNSSGKAEWATSVETIDIGSSPSIATDISGNIFIAGRYNISTLTIKDYDSAPIGGGAVGLVTYGTLTNSGNPDIYLIKYNSSGKSQWATSVGGLSGQYAPKITTDNIGKIYITGEYNDPTLIINNYASAPIAAGPVGVTRYGTLAGSSESDIFLVKYS